MIDKDSPLGAFPAITNTTLDAVHFVKDYIQLQFAHLNVSLLDEVVLLDGEVRLPFGSRDFPFRLIGLIDSSVTSVELSTEGLLFTFSSGANVLASLNHLPESVVLSSGVFVDSLPR